MTAPTVSSVVAIAIPARVNILSKGPRHDDATANAKRVPKLFNRVQHFRSYSSSSVAYMSERGIAVAVTPSLDMEICTT